MFLIQLITQFRLLPYDTFVCVAAILSQNRSVCMRVIRYRAEEEGRDAVSVEFKPKIRRIEWQSRTQKKGRRKEKMPYNQQL